MTKKSIIIIASSLIITSLIIVGSFFYSQLNSEIKADVVDAYEAVELKIEPGDSVFKIAQNLDEKNLINSKIGFYWHLLISGHWSQLKPGEYLVPSNSDLENLILIITSGSSPQTKLTIKEGWTIDQIDSYLSSSGLIKKGAFIAESEKVGKYRVEYDFISQRARTLEGYLFPDTYYVLSDFESDQLVKKMLSVFERKIFTVYGPETKQKLPSGLDSFYQLITLASIIEKEANQYNEMRMVSDVFIKRINDDSLLQACSTVNYLLDEPKLILLQSDISIESKYNTYLYPGLPPGPIGSPGEDAIKSVLNRRNTDFWYFLSDEEGNLHFSQTNDEHEQKKSIYLK